MGGCWGMGECDRGWVGVRSVGVGGWVGVRGMGVGRWVGSKGGWV